MTSQQKPKILYLSTLGEQGGAQKYMVDLASVFKKRYRIALASGGAAHNYLRQQSLALKVDYYHLSRLKRQIRPFNDLLAFYQIFRLCRRYRPDIVHLNSSKAGSLGAVAAKLAGVKKIIYTVHGLVLNEHLNRLQKIFYWLAEKISAGFKQKFICVSQADRQSLIRHKITRRNKITVIHNGIDAKTLNFLNRADARLKLGLLADQTQHEQNLLIGSIANLYPTKGLIYFVKAAHLVRQQYPRVRFIVIGEGPREKTLRQLIHILKLENNFFLIGGLPQAANYLKAFDIFVLPSIKEGLPYTLLEAAAAGLPVIATQVGGVPEIIQSNYNGLLVKPADASRLAAAISKLVTDKKLRAGLANAQSETIKRFELSRAIQQTEKIYSSLIGN
jgi:glycosyltransferase involved in cell wall biosynthesis